MKLANIDTYQQTLDYLFSQLPMYQRVGQAAIKKDLTNITGLLKALGNPHRGLPCIHVAGTNGKGTVSHLIAAVLQSAGYRTALYTSPHYRDFRERIKIDGEWIDHESVIHFTEMIRTKIDAFRPSFFEISVAMAFDYFHRQTVDVAVIETGLGGRLDSTNVVDPLISVITNISFDHMDMLGNTIFDIAGEKAGIIKPKRPVIIGLYQRSADAVFLRHAADKKAPIRFASLSWEVTRQGTELRCFDKIRMREVIVTGNDAGPFFNENLVTALETVSTLNDMGLFQITGKDLVRGVSEYRQLTHYLGRWQILGRDPLVVADSAHNTDALLAVGQWLAQTQAATKHLVLGFTNEKKVDDLLDYFPHEARYYLVRANIPRAMPVERIKRALENRGVEARCFETVREGVSAAHASAGQNDLIFIGGSSYVVGEAI